MAELFDFVERYGSGSKITRDQEIQMWGSLKTAVNGIIARCNSANGSSISAITFVTQATKGGLLSAAEYDANISAVQGALNAVIQASGPQGLNPSNYVDLFKRSEQLYPLLIWQRDSNLRTIQTVLNAINKMYQWVGK